MAEEKKTELDMLKEKLANLANKSIILHNNLGLIQTAGQSTIIMAECLKLSEQNMQILNKKED